LRTYIKVKRLFFLAAGRFVDAWKNKETLPVTQMEESLSEIETHYERIEQQKIKELQTSRALELSEFEADFIPGNLGELTEQVWSNFLLGTKTAYELKKQAEKEAQEKELERVRIESLHNERTVEILDLWQFVPDADKQNNFGLYTQSSWVAFHAYLLEEKHNFELEQERIRIENENLQKQLKIQQEKADQERKAQEEKLRLANAEREKSEKLLKEKADQERKAQEEKLAKLEFDLQKGDADKFQDLINDLEVLKTKYSFKSEKNKKKYYDVSILLEKIITHIK